MGLGKFGVDNGDSLCERLLLAGEAMASLRYWNESSMAELSWPWRRTGIGQITHSRGHVLKCVLESKSSGRILNKRKELNWSIMGKLWGWVSKPGKIKPSDPNDYDTLEHCFSRSDGVCGKGDFVEK